MKAEFPTEYKQIISRLQNIEPVKYAATRNFVDGDVTYLSPYISRGVISTNQVKAEVLKKYPFSKIYKFIQELAWREYWQRVWQNKGDLLFTDLKHPQPDVAHREMIRGIDDAATTIGAVDEHINNLYQTGYMHNHVRMYVASLACNNGKAHWLEPAKWMYYHLLDADPASNHLSWQWVAGAFSGKKYYCNQENINKYTGSNQRNSFLDKEYAAVETMPVPAALTDTFLPEWKTELPVTAKPTIDKGVPSLIYNAYNLDPLWRRGENANRILLLEPSYFAKFPCSEKVIGFIMALSKNIDGVQVFTGEITELFSSTDEVISKEHPSTMHYMGLQDSRDWMFPQVTGYYPSFSAFWKKCEKSLPYNG